MFWLVRHGQADWDQVARCALKGFRTDFTPLTTLGEAQIEQSAKDPRLHQADLIVSSPYTRAMQSAAILSRKLGLPIEVQHGLHEWLPDLNGDYDSPEDIWAAARDYETHQGVPHALARWESRSSLRSRALAALKPYRGFEQVIAVTHEMLIWSLTGQRDVENGEVVLWQGG